MDCEVVGQAGVRMLWCGVEEGLLGRMAEMEWGCDGGERRRYNNNTVMRYHRPSRGGIGTHLGV